MALILDGSSEHLAHVRIKAAMPFRIATFVDLNRFLEQADSTTFFMVLILDGSSEHVAHV